MNKSIIVLLLFVSIAGLTSCSAINSEQGDDISESFKSIKTETNSQESSNVIMELTSFNIQLEGFQIK